MLPRRPSRVDNVDNEDEEEEERMEEGMRRSINGGTRDVKTRSDIVGLYGSGGIVFVVLAVNRPADRTD